MLKGFRDFILRGNVIELAVAVVIGSAFTQLVTQFGDSFLDPLIQLFAGGGEFGGVFHVREAAFTWGLFIGAVVTFLVTAAVVYFLVVVPMNRSKARFAKAAEAGPTEAEILAEIRDLLRAQRR